MRSFIGGDSTDNLQQLLKTGALSDITMSCRNGTFHAHSALLVAFGGLFFEKAICAGFKESSTSIIILPEDEPETLRRVLSHIYGGDYAEGRTETTCHRKHSGSIVKQAQDSDMRLASCPENCPSLLQIHFHITMFAAAAKFGIPSLREAARKNFFIAYMTHRREEKEKERHWRPDWKSLWIDGIESIFFAVYSTTPSCERDLRDICLPYLLDYERWCKEVDWARRNTNFRDEFRAFCSRIPGLQEDMQRNYDLFDDMGWACNNCTDMDSDANYPSAIVSDCPCDMPASERSYRQCKRHACNVIRQARAQCASCGAKGTLDFMLYRYILAGEVWREWDDKQSVRDWAQKLGYRLEDVYTDARLYVRLGGKDVPDEVYIQIREAMLDAFLAGLEEREEMPLEELRTLVRGAC